MTSRLLISLSLLLFAGQQVFAQLAPAEDFFNSGAQFYISNNIPAALEHVEDGLKTHPDDEKLKRLEALLKQQQQQQQQQKDQQQQNQQNQQSQQQKAQDRQKQQEEKQKQAEQKQADQQKQQQPPDQQKQAGQQDQKESEDQAVKAGEMTPAEAKRLLDSQKDNEQLLQMKPPDKPQNPLHTIKDW
jgi:outer membrane biosynthesis protein TonB